MPVDNRSTGVRLSHTVYCAEKWSHRLLGLLSLQRISSPKAILIQRCNGIHTFTMDQPIGAAFLHQDGRVLRLESSIPPRRIIPFVPGCRSVLEWPADSAINGSLHVGDHLEVKADAPFPETASAWPRFFHSITNFCLALLWLGFVVTTFSKWLDQQSFKSLGLFLYNTLLVYLFLSRRHSEVISHRWQDWLAAAGTVLISLSLRPTPFMNPLLQTISLIGQTVGISATIFALASLGKSFGIVPANRSIKTNGAYRWIRHPLYSAELLFLAAFVLGHPSFANLIKGALITVGQIVRVLAEEKLLAMDPAYRSYRAHVRYRFIPHVF